MEHLDIISRMAEIIDFHTHAFPDSIAERAIRSIQRQAGITAFLDGTISSLLASMDKNGISKSVICSIATKPEQFDSILSWSKKIRSDRIIPFLSIHPADKKFLERLDIVTGEGFKGIKLHPYYQDFRIDEERMMQLYEGMAGHGLILLMHTGFDFAFKRVRKATPAGILRIWKEFPSLKLVTTHLGAWNLWDEVEQTISGKAIRMEISFALEFLSTEDARRIILSHPDNYILFGTDSPWADQGATIALFRKLKLGIRREQKTLFLNASKLLRGQQ
jgi:predicted TIM-barrel fold metal-dependent hydrolase